MARSRSLHVKRSANERSAQSGTRLPRQRRAQGTVNAILTAAKELLIRKGLEGTTTNAIAERAGVSIGSLYQYFRGLDGVVEELSRRHVERALQLLFAEAEALRDEALEVGMRRLIRLMVELHRQDPELGRVLGTARPGLSARTHLARMDQQIMAAACAYLTAHRELIVVDDVERAAFIVVGSIEALTHNAMMQRPELLEGDVLVDDVSRLVLGYLTGHAKVGEPTPSARNGRSEAI